MLRARPERPRASRRAAARPAAVVDADVSIVETRADLGHAPPVVRGEERMPPTRRGAIVVASVVLHVAMFVVLSMAPEPTRAVPDEVGWTPIELVPWRGEDPSGGSPTAGLPPVTAADPSAPSEPAPSEPAPSEPAASRGATPEPAAPQPPAAPDPGAFQPATVPAAPEPHAARPGTQPPTDALALDGLRSLGKPGGTVPAPRVSASTMGTGKPAKPGVDLPQPRNGGADRGTPRSLDEAGFARDRSGDRVYREPAGHFTAKLLPDGRVHFKDHILKPTLTNVPMPDLYTVVRKAQQRELWSRDKAELLKRTFDLRLLVAIEFAERNVERRLKALYRDLITIWSDDARPAVARRKILFERWDECDEAMAVSLPGFDGETHSTIDELRQGAGLRARTTITGFIRKHLPAGSEDAYDSAELAELNRRRVSRDKFAPYAAAP